MATVGLTHLDYEVRRNSPYLILVIDREYATIHLRVRGVPHPRCQTSQGIVVLPVYVHNAVVDESQLCPACFSAHKREIKIAIGDTEQLARRQ